MTDKERCWELARDYKPGDIIHEKIISENISYNILMGERFVSTTFRLTGTSPILQIPLKDIPISLPRTGRSFMLDGEKRFMYYTYNRMADPNLATHDSNGMLLPNHDIWFETAGRLLTIYNITYDADAVGAELLKYYKYAEVVALNTEPTMSANDSLNPKKGTRWINI